MPHISYFLSKTYVVGTQKNRLNETVLLSTLNICLNCWVRKYSQFYVVYLFVNLYLTFLLASSSRFSSIIHRCFEFSPFSKSFSRISRKAFVLRIHIGQFSGFWYLSYKCKSNTNVFSRILGVVSVQLQFSGVNFGPTTVFRCKFWSNYSFQV